MTTTAYLDLFLRSISEPALLEIFLRFILLHQHENVHILDTLTSRINTPFRVRFQESSFCNKIMNILFSLPPSPPFFSFFLAAIAFSTLETENAFCYQEPFCQGGGTYCLTYDMFLNLSGLALFSVELAECASEEHVAAEHVGVSQRTRVQRVWMLEIIFLSSSILKWKCGQL